MLALSPFVLLFSVITPYLHVFSSLAALLLPSNRLGASFSRKSKCRPACSTPIAQFSAALGELSNCVLVAVWFIVMRNFGLFRPLSPRWRKQSPVSKHELNADPSLVPPRKPPDKFRRGILFLFLAYLCVIVITTTQVWCENASLATLSAVPLTMSSGLVASHLATFTTKYSHQPADFIFQSADCHFDSTNSSNAIKSSMLSAWQSSNATKSIIMDYAPGSNPICVDTGASVCISNNKNDFISLVKISSETIQGIGSGLQVEGKGTLRWIIYDDDGQEVTLYVRDALYVPGVQCVFFVLSKSLCKQ
jgi:hypothetical protein